MRRMPHTVYYFHYRNGYIYIIVFVVKRCTIRKAKIRPYTLRQAKIRIYAVRKGKEGFTLNCSINLFNVTFRKGLRSGGSVVKRSTRKW